MIDKRFKNAIKVATLELCCGDQPLRNRLSRAIQTLEGVLGQREEWPPALYRRLQDISDEIKSRSPAEAAINAMEKVRYRSLRMGRQSAAVCGIR